jgi:MFS family permease
VLLRLALATALVGLPFLLGAENIAVAVVGLAVTGMGIGGTFPLASSLYIAASHRTADQALGQILTVAGIAQIIGPLAAGAVAQAAGLRMGLLVLPVFVLLAAATTTRAADVISRARSAVQPRTPAASVRRRPGRWVSRRR